ncbi:MAG: 4-hydroxy-3-methylbut-2-enyl diphosphate reductase [Clostridia bacterium]|nr:4-hydroxy-3-methylbut-2-enyl diphosphate reductase [Clostridia bacterium]
MKKITIAENSGFCPGVQKAVDTALREKPGTFVLGDIIHNDDVIRELTEAGIIKVDDLSRVPDGGRVIFRSHGVTREHFDECLRRGIEIVNCTCPYVEKTQRIVKKLHDEGKTIVIVGDRTHPEVEGLLGWCEGRAYVVDDPSEDLGFIKEDEVSVVCQTTFPEAKFDVIVKNIGKLREKSVEVYKTICYTTIGRQKEAEEMSRENDCMIVIGGLNSSNTNKLFEICRENCGNVIRLASSSDFDPSLTEGFSKIGIVSGASTPKAQAREVFGIMAEKDEMIPEETMEEKSAEKESLAEETAAAEETVTEETLAETTEAEESAPEAADAEDAEAETAAQETPAEENVAEEPAPAESGEEPEAAEEEKAEEPVEETKAEGKEPETEPNPMDEALRKIDRESRFKRGQIVTAAISEANDDGLMILLPFSKKEIALSKDDLDCEEYDPAEYEKRIGEQIDLLVVDLKPTLKLSQKMIRLQEEESAIIEELKTGKEFTIECTGSNKGGLTGSLGQYVVFVPAKEIRPGYVKDLSKYIGQTLRLRLIEIKSDNRRKEIIASQRVILQEERDAKAAERKAVEDEFFDSVRVGDIVEGRVDRTASFGAFVSVKGFDCLAHISDLSWKPIRRPEDVLKIGETYNFKVLAVDSEKRKVSIGLKQLIPQPWDTVNERYAVGDVVHGKVVRLVQFGAFINVEEGVDGLVHISQLSHDKVENPSDVVKVGDEVDAKIIRLEPENRRMNLSISALIPDDGMARKPARERKPKAESGEKPARGSRGRKSSFSSEDDELTSWSDSSSSMSTSIAELIASKNKDEN